MSLVKLDENDDEFKFIEFFLKLSVSRVKLKNLSVYIIPSSNSSFGAHEKVSPCHVSLGLMLVQVVCLLRSPSTSSHPTTYPTFTPLHTWKRSGIT